MGGKMCKAAGAAKRVYSHDKRSAAVTCFFKGQITLDVVNLILEYEVEFIGEKLHTFTLGLGIQVHPIANGAFLCRRGRRVVRVYADSFDFLPFEARDEIATMAASDNKLALSTHKGPEILTWNMDTNKPMATLVGHTRIPTQMVFLSDGRLLSTSGLSIRVWDLACNDQTIIYAAAHALAALPNGQFATAQAGDTTVWTADGLPRHRFKRPGVAFKQTLVVLNDSLLASVKTASTLPDNVDLYNFVTGKCVARLAFHVVEAVCLSFSGMLVVAHSEEAKPTVIELFDVATLQWYRKVKIDGFLGTMARLSNGHLVVTNYNLPLTTVEVWR